MAGKSAVASFQVEAGLVAVAVAVVVVVDRGRCSGSSLRTLAVAASSDGLGQAQPGT